MNKVVNIALVVSCLLAFQTWTAGASGVAQNVVSKNTMSQVLSKALVAAHFCVDGLKQGASYIGNKVGNLTIAAWDKMPVQVKDKLTYAWAKLTQTTTGKIASGTVGAAVIVAAMYKLTNKIHSRTPKAA